MVASNKTCIIKSLRSYFDVLHPVVCFQSGIAVPSTQLTKFKQKWHVPSHFVFIYLLHVSTFQEVNIRFLPRFFNVLSFCYDIRVYSERCHQQYFYCYVYLLPQECLLSCYLATTGAIHIQTDLDCCTNLWLWQWLILIKSVFIYCIYLFDILSTILYSDCNACDMFYACIYIFWLVLHPLACWPRGSMESEIKWQVTRIQPWCKGNSTNKSLECNVYIKRVLYLCG
jgi:hypothetical protein